MANQVKMALWGEEETIRSGLLQLLRCPSVKVASIGPTLKDTHIIDIAAEYHIAVCDNFYDLLAAADAAIIGASPCFIEEVTMCIKAGKHFFIDASALKSAAEMKEIASMIKESNVKCQIGLTDRFYPLYEKALEYVYHPKIILIERFDDDARSERKSMLEDIHVILSLARSPIKSVAASAASVFSDRIDILSARFSFFNGCAAMLTVGRLPAKREKRISIFQKNAYIEIDFLQQKARILRKNEKTQKEEETVYGEEAAIAQPNLYSAINAFVASIRENKPIAIDVYDGLRSLEVALQIEEILSK